MEVSGLEVESELQLPVCTAATSRWDLSYICNICCSLRQRQIVKPLSKSRDRTWILVRFLTHWATIGTPQSMTLLLQQLKELRQKIVAARRLGRSNWRVISSKVSLIRSSWNSQHKVTQQRKFVFQELGLPSTQATPPPSPQLRVTERGVQPQWKHADGFQTIETGSLSKLFLQLESHEALLNGCLVYPLCYVDIIFFTSRK